MYQFTPPKMGQPAASPIVRRRRSSKRLLLVLAATIQLVAMTILGVGPAASEQRVVDSTSNAANAVAEAQATFEVSLYCDRLDTPTLSWDAVPGAQSYEVQTSYVRSLGTTNPYWTTFSTDHVRYGQYSTATKVQVPCYHLHEFRIRAMRYDGSVVATSTIVGTSDPGQISRTFPEPRNLRPAWTNNRWGGGSYDRLTWTSVPRAEGYNVYDATTNRYLTTVKTPWYRPVFPGDFYVTAFDGNGNFSRRSNTASIDGTRL